MARSLHDIQKLVTKLIQKSKSHANKEERSVKNAPQKTTESPLGLNHPNTDDAVRRLQSRKVRPL